MCYNMAPKPLQEHKVLMFRKHRSNTVTMIVSQLHCHTSAVINAPPPSSVYCYCMLHHHVL